MEPFLRAASNLAYTPTVSGRPTVHRIALFGLLGLGCDPGSAQSAADEADEAEASFAADVPDAEGSPSDDAPEADEAPDAAPVALGADPSSSPTHAALSPADPGAPTPLVAPPPPSLPIGHRRAERALMVYVEPRLGTAFRGKIPHGEVFGLYELVEGNDEECRGEGWGRIGAAAYVCLRHTEPVEDEGAALPARLPDRLAPFYYARLRGKEGSDDRPPAPYWRSRGAMLANAAPEGSLQPEHDYIFVERRRYRDGVVLTTPNGRVVRERDVRRLKPSVFRGRDMLERPVPAGTVQAWSVEWPFAIVRQEPHPEAAAVGRIPLHAQALAHDETRVHDGETWVAMAEPAVGWALADHVRHWVTFDPPAGVRDDELWIDVDLDQQMLALRRGPVVEYLTLISSGTPKHPTPIGLYRIEGKWAFADMRSRAGDEEEYYVEGVPWAQYFKGRYALHGTFWHNRFGRRTSHGCINLSAHDARWVYERTWPVAKPGWLVINEHAQEPGTVLRVRKSARNPPDRREPPPGA
jgi:L,D-transpeptidase catalytic domain